MFTEEQLAIINDAPKYNIIVEAVAGSGKTTTAIGIAQQNPDKKILLITYNSALKDETRMRTKNLKNMVVENYHSLTKNFYGAKNYRDDEGIVEVFKNNLPFINEFIPDIIVLDEVQDMDMNYYQLIRKLQKDLNNRPLLCIFGDSKQTLYEYKGSSPHFLQAANLIFKNQKKWKKLNLSESFRITKKMANFLNKVYYKSDFIFSNKDSNEEIDYIFYKWGEHFKKTGKYLIEQIKKYGEKNTLVLGPSVKLKNNSPISLFNNQLVKLMPIFLKDNDKVIDKKTALNKLEITTIHSVKGRENDLVIVFGFDSFYYSYNKEIDHQTPIDLFYVAMTRAKKKLILLNSSTSSPFPFLDLNQLKKYTNIIGECEIYQTPDKLLPKEFVVTSLCEHIPYHFLDDFKNNVTVTSTRIDSDLNFNNLTNKIKINYLNREIVEDVAWINGELVTTVLKNDQDSNIDELYEQTKNLVELIKRDDENFYWDKDNVAEIGKVIQKKVTNDISGLTEWALIKDMLFTRSNHNYVQVKDSGFDWLDQKFYHDVFEIMKKINFNSNWVIEEELLLSKETFKDVAKKFIKESVTIRGRIDAYDLQDDTLWEFKIVKIISTEMFLQVAIYAYLMKTTIKTPKKIKVFNLYNLKVYELNFDYNWFESYLKKLIEFKLGSNLTKTREKFLAEVKEYE